MKYNVFCYADVEEHRDGIEQMEGEIWYRSTTLDCKYELGRHHEHTWICEADADNMGNVPSECSFICQLDELPDDADQIDLTPEPDEPECCIDCDEELDPDNTNLYCHDCEIRMMFPMINYDTHCSFVSCTIADYGYKLYGYTLDEI